MDYLDNTLQKRVIFLTGKGGVGKTTLAWATALACHRQGKKVAVVGWNPSGKEGVPTAPSELGIPWVGLETLAAFREYALQIIRFEKIYDTVLDNRILRTFVMAAPGLADAVVAGKILDLYEKQQHDLLIVDMPSSGHALSFFRSPLGLQKIFKMGFIARDAERVCALFRSPDVRLDLVATPEELPLVECQELKDKLTPLHGFTFGYLHLNQCLPDWIRTSDAELALVPQIAKPLYERFNHRWQEEKSVSRLAERIGMTRIAHDRIATDSWKTGVEALADRLIQ